MEAVLRKEYLDEFEQLEANLFVANRLLPKSDTFHRGIAFGAYNVADAKSGGASEGCPRQRKRPLRDRLIRR